MRVRSHEERSKRDRVTRRWFRNHDQEWYEQQDKDKQWIKENEMTTYTQVFEGFLNDNAEGLLKNAKAPKYRSSGSGKSAIVTTIDIPAGSVIALAAWGGKGNYGQYIKISGQLVHPDQHSQPPQQQAPQQQQEPPPFDDDIPF